MNEIGTPPTRDGRRYLQEQVRATLVEDLCIECGKLVKAAPDEIVVRCVDCDTDLAEF